MDDLISRQAAIEAVGINTWAGFRLKDLPSAQLEQKIGIWFDRGCNYVCNQCWLTEKRRTRFCPECGAEMVGFL